MELQVEHSQQEFNAMAVPRQWQAVKRTEGFGIMIPLVHGSSVRVAAPAQE